MKRKVTLGLFLIYNLLFSQVIQYDFHNINSRLKYELILNGNKSESEWRMVIDAKGTNVSSEDITKSIYKSGNAYFLADKTLKKRIALKDSVSMKWSQQKETKVILGYECKSATTEFRGRNYTVFYTDELKIAGAPWKFNDIDGLVLEAYSDEEDYKFEATSIILDEIKYDSNRIELFKAYNLINWSEFVDLYTNEINQFIKNEKCDCENDGGSVLKVSRMEEVVPGLNRTGIVY